jgi:hypothetical protein
VEDDICEKDVCGLRKNIIKHLDTIFEITTKYLFERIPGAYSVPKEIFTHENSHVAEYMKDFAQKMGIAVWKEAIRNIISELTLNLDYNGWVFIRICLSACGMKNLIAYDSRISAC